jgi:hypothetical protein
MTGQRNASCQKGSQKQLSHFDSLR